MTMVNSGFKELKTTLVSRSGSKVTASNDTVFFLFVKKNYFQD